ncbi:hypothetical protein C5167_030440 [Papaver somniferum]|uniref:CASP-like protein 4B1 n=1 Tax=Papaver somniferum TaxID=3469 RepID=UPI000E6F87ED|nr:CASP-like protein 4B1 [Papaver somniferum]RZC86363.1 hypothetical protein C5167_030440 [Papaver somniferum]
MESGAQPTATIATSTSTEGSLKYGSLVLWDATFVFSIVSFPIMASNEGFDAVHEFSYILAACVISTVYTLLQNIRQIYYISTGNSLFEACTSSAIDFFGDQIVAYLLISSASAAAPTISSLKEYEDSVGGNHSASSKSAASTGMAFVAFFPLALSAMLSGYKLSTKTYI